MASPLAVRFENSRSFCGLAYLSASRSIDKRDLYPARLMTTNDMMMSSLAAIVLLGGGGAFDASRQSAFRVQLARENNRTTAEQPSWLMDREQNRQSKCGSLPLEANDDDCRLGHAFPVSAGAHPISPRKAHHFHEIPQCPPSLCNVQNLSFRNTRTDLPAIHFAHTSETSAVCRDAPKQQEGCFRRRHRSNLVVRRGCCQPFASEDVDDTSESKRQPVARERRVPPLLPQPASSTLASLKFEPSSVAFATGSGATSSHHHNLYLQATAATSSSGPGTTAPSTSSPSSSIVKAEQNPYDLIAPPVAKRPRIDTPSVSSTTSSSEPSPTTSNNGAEQIMQNGHELQQNGGSVVAGGNVPGQNEHDLIYNGADGRSKLNSAASVESLDNCSTVSSGDPNMQVRTLFVSGLPMDARSRELYLLFRSLPGYETSQLKVSNKNGKASAPVGFVTFNTPANANSAKQTLQGVRFDPELSQTLRLELARSNTKVSKPKQPSPMTGFNPAVMPPVVRTPTSAAALLADHQLQAATAANILDQFSAINEQNQLMAAANFTLPIQGLPLLHGTNPQFLQQNALLQQQAHLQQILAQNGMYGLLGQAGTAASPGIPAVSSVAGIAPSANGNPPCSTLFVANLGPAPNEDELRQLFKKFPGFSRLRLNAKSGSPVAFVEFQDVRQASYVLTALQGTQLSSNDRGTGIRIEYAKTKMGEGSVNGTHNGNHHHSQQQQQQAQLQQHLQQQQQHYAAALLMQQLG